MLPPAMYLCTLIDAAAVPLIDVGVIWPTIASPVASDCRVNVKGFVRVKVPVPFIVNVDAGPMLTAAPVPPPVIVGVAGELTTMPELIVNDFPVLIVILTSLALPKVIELTTAAEFITGCLLLLYVLTPIRILSVEVGILPELQLLPSSHTLLELPVQSIDAVQR